MVSQHRQEASSLADRALAFAEEAHGAQTYGSGPYGFHLREVMRVTRELGHTDPVMLAAAALHDVLEDTLVTRHTLEERFGAEVANLVAELTHHRDQSFEAYLAGMSPRGFVLKVADRIVNAQYLDLANGNQIVGLRDELLPRYQGEMAAFATRAAQLGGAFPTLVSKLGRVLESARVRLTGQHLTAENVPQDAKNIAEQSRGAAGQHRASGLLAFRLMRNSELQGTNRSQRVRLAAQLEGALLAFYSLSGIGRALLRVATRALLTPEGRRAYQDLTQKVDYVEAGLRDTLSLILEHVEGEGLPTNEDVIALTAVVTLFEHVQRSLLEAAREHAPDLLENIGEDLDYHHREIPLAEKLVSMLLEGGGAQRRALEQIRQRILHRGDLALPPDGVDLSNRIASSLAPNAFHQTSANLDTLYEQAAEAEVTLKSLVREVARETGGEPMWAPGLKLRDRALQRIKVNFGGDARLITDLARASLKFTSLTELYHALEVLHRRADIVKIKDRFVEPFPNGYRDLLLNLRMPNGHVVELQLHLGPLFEASHDIGRDLYVGARQLLARAGEEERVLTAEEVDILQQWNEAGQRVYRDAMRECGG